MLSALVVGTFLPGFGATAGVSIKALTGLFGGAAAGEAVDTASAFAAGSSINYGIIKLLNKVDGPAVFDSCGCEKSNSGIGAALHNLIY